MQTETFDPNKDIITFTEGAQKHFAQAVANEGAIGVKLGLKGGGCAGFAFEWTVIRDIGDIRLQDFSVNYGDWTFWLDDNSKPYLIGSVVHLRTGVAGTYIEVESPKASGACGCGESISFTI
jgi:iron-sulfur cluster assembly protein